MIIETTELRKTFTRRGAPVEAVRGIDLGVKETEIFGFLGPNGAGKTTTIRMLTTLLRPDGGQAALAGHDLLAHPGRVRGVIGYVQQTGGLWDASTPREELVLQARFQGLGARAARARSAEVIDLLDIGEFADRRCIALSGGQRRRVEIGLGIVHAPALLFLDEPSTGLDPNSRSALWAAIRTLRDTGVTVFLTTHYLDEADALCDRIAIVDHGVVVTTGAPAELKHEVSGDIVTVTLDRGGAGVDAAAAALRTRAGVVSATADATLLRLVADDGAAVLPAVLAACAEQRLAVTGVDVHHPSLDDVFVHRTGHAIGATA